MRLKLCATLESIRAPCALVKPPVMLRPWQRLRRTEGWHKLVTSHLSTVARDARRPTTINSSVMKKWLLALPFLLLACKKDETPQNVSFKCTGGATGAYVITYAEGGDSVRVIDDEAQFTLGRGGTATVSAYATDTSRFTMRVEVDGDFEEERSGNFVRLTYTWRKR
jgi:hypothetical protein